MAGQSKGLNTLLASATVNTPDPSDTEDSAFASALSEDKLVAEPDPTIPPAPPVQPEPAPEVQELIGGIPKSALSQMEIDLAKAIPNINIPSEYTPTFGVSVQTRIIPNLPAIFVAAWPAIPISDNNFSLQDVANRGYVPVEPEQFSTDPRKADQQKKLYIPNGQVKTFYGKEYVCVGDTVACIGLRQNRDRRKALERMAVMASLNSHLESRKAAGVEVELTEKQIQAKELFYGGVADYSPFRE